MKYFQYKIDDKEGLCNQLMAIFRTLGEALFYSTQNESVGIILNDVQTRNSIDLDIHPYFSKINIDSFVDVNELITLLANRKISVSRLQEDNNEFQDDIITCRRLPIRNMLPSESRKMGIFIGESFPFAKSILKIASCIIGLMSFFPRWKAVHLRIEGDLLHIPSIREAGLETHTKNQVQQTINMISSSPNLSAVYIATGIQEEKYHNAVNIINEKLPHLTITRKKDILKDYPDIKEELESLSLEEQALVDWLVCIGAPVFAGNHASSFAYLAGYIRHYRGFDKETTHLWPDYQPYWDAWFPRV
jgi:hypothetical protein